MDCSTILMTSLISLSKKAFVLERDAEDAAILSPEETGEPLKLEFTKDSTFWLMALLLSTERWCFGERGMGGSLGGVCFIYKMEYKRLIKQLNIKGKFRDLGIMGMWAKVSQYSSDDCK